MPTIKLSYGERFLNWYPKHTKLYVRGQRGKDWNEQRALDSELAKEINAWVQKQVDEALRERDASRDTSPEIPILKRGQAQPVCTCIADPAAPSHLQPPCPVCNP